MRRRRRDAEIERWLDELGPQLEGWRAPEPGDAAFAAAREAAGRALRAPRAPRPLQRVAAGFPAELARLFAAAALPLALVLAVDVWVIWRGPELLAAWLPTALAVALPLAYGVGALGWLALVVGSLPVVAQRRALARAGGGLE